MSGKKLLFYLVALLLVAGGYYYSEFRHSRQEVKEQSAKKIFQFKADDISALTLTSDKGKIELQRVPATDKLPAPEPAAAPSATPPPKPAAAWQLTKPIAVKADELTINSILNALADLKIQRRLDGMPADKLKDYGLEKPTFTLDFQAAGESHQLRFGHKVPGDKSIYAQKDQNPEVLLISVADKETLERTLTALRHKAIFTLAPEKVTEIRIIKNQDRLTFQRTEPSVWSIGDKPQTKLRTDRIEALLRQFAGIKALEFVAEKVDDLKKYGLVPSPALRLTLLSGKQEETLLLGSKQGERYYAQISGTDPIILVDKSLVENLPTSYEALEDRRLWAGKDADVQKVVWGASDKQITAVRDKNGWSLQIPDSPAVPVPSLKFGLALWRLKDLEFIRLLPAVDSTKDATPVFTLQLFGPEDKPLFQMEELQTDKDQVRITFSQGEKTVAAMIPAKVLTELKQTLESLAIPETKNQEKAPAAK
jgi:hypothetical protein